LTRIIEEEGYVPRRDFGIYTDIASTHLYKDGMYHLPADNKVLSRGEMIDKLAEMCADYPIISMEDCLYEDDWEGWKLLTKRLGGKVQLVGDDLFVTSPRRLKKGIEMGVANAVVIKPNQVGTLTETFQTIEMAKEAGYGTIISPRSGELWDPYVAHLCVGQSLGQGKIAMCPSGGNTLNELIRIGDYLGEKAIYRDGSMFSRFLAG
jgi:enolase